MKRHYSRKHPCKLDKNVSSDIDLDVKNLKELISNDCLSIFIDNPNNIEDNIPVLDSVVQEKVIEFGDLDLHDLTACYQQEPEQINDVTAHQEPEQINDVTAHQETQTIKLIIDEQGVQTNEVILNEQEAQTNELILNEQEAQTNELIVNDQEAQTNEVILNDQEAQTNEVILKDISCQTIEPDTNKLLGNDDFTSENNDYNRLDMILESLKLNHKYRNIKEISDDDKILMCLYLTNCLEKQKKYYDNKYGLNREISQNKDEILKNAREENNKIDELNTEIIKKDELLQTMKEEVKSIELGIKLAKAEVGVKDDILKRERYMNKLLKDELKIKNDMIEAKNKLLKQYQKDINEMKNHEINYHIVFDLKNQYKSVNISNLEEISDGDLLNKIKESIKEYENINVYTQIEKISKLDKRDLFNFLE